MLSATGISVRFGGVRAVDAADFTLTAGELVGVIGPNGSGKSTLLNALCGVVRADGRLEVAGRTVPLGRPAAARRHGIARVFQAPQTYLELSVLDNVVLGAGDRSGTGVAGAWLRRRHMWRHERARCHAAMAVLEQVGLAALAERPSGALSYGQRRLLDLARAVLADPKVVLLDEPSAGLNDVETDEMGAVLSTLNAAGLSLVVVDHKIELMTRLCHRLLVLELGRVVTTGRPADVLADPRVVAAYLGVPDDARR